MAAVLPDLSVVRRLIRSQAVASVRGLSGTELRVVGSGWDNLVVCDDGDYVARLPLHPEAADLAAVEVRWLPELAPLLSVATPVPVFVGSPTSFYPWPWQVCRRIPGTVAAEVEPTHRGGMVDGLAGALCALHRPAPAGAPVNLHRGGSIGARGAIVAERIDRWPGPRDALRSAWRAALAARPWSGRPRWVHGDPHPRNLVVDEPGRLAGILDFGDLTAGDPANDLATTWWTFEEPDRERFVATANDLAG